MLGVDKVRLRGRYYLHLGSHLDKFLLVYFIALGKKVSYSLFLTVAYYLTRRAQVPHNKIIHSINYRCFLINIQTIISGGISVKNIRNIDRIFCTDLGLSPAILQEGWAILQILAWGSSLKRERFY